MKIDYIQIIIFAALAIIFAFYLIIAKKREGRGPKIPLGLFVLFFLLRGLVPLFEGVDLGSTAQSVDTAAAIILWMAIIRIIVFVIVDYFVRHKKQIIIPTITRDFALAMLYVVTAMIVLKHRTDVNLGSLLTTSAILTAVVGFAMQDTLGNLFSGLALQIEHPYQIGDWIGFEGMEGKVVGITWKSTKILTRTEELIFVPNNTISKATLVNFSRPSPKHITFLEVGTSYDDPPNKVKKAITETILNHPMVVKSHPPLVLATKFDDFSINYKAFFATEDFASEGKTRYEILGNLWYKFRREGIKIPYPIQEEWQVAPSDIVEKEKQKELVRKKAIPSILAKIDLFEVLAEAEREELTGRIEILDFAKGEAIVLQGDESGPMYIIKEGECSVLVSHGGERPAEVARLKPGQFFGEMTVLTGAPRTATVIALTDVECYEIEKDDLKKLFVSHPEVLSGMSEVLSKRQAELDVHKAKSEDAGKVVDQQKNQFIAKIKSFFGL